MVSSLTDEYLTRAGILKLLEIKDSDIRIMVLEQARDSADKGIHIGGAFSATIPLISLFYGGIINLDIANPTRRGQDMFILSEGHTLTPMASIFADLGYYERSVLCNSRSIESILNGHPGPLLPGVYAATGPLAQGIGVAEGLAMVGKKNPHYDVFCLNGDGELQEGPAWEAIMFSRHKKLDNFCVLVNKNSGQLDDTKQLIVPMPDLDKKFSSFGWRVFSVDGTQYGPVLDALQTFKFAPRDGRPTAIICRTRKGFGAFSNFIMGHKVTMPDALTEQEIRLQELRRSERVAEFLEFFNKLELKGEPGLARDQLLGIARNMNLEIVFDAGKAIEVKPIIVPVQTRRAPKRDKKIAYDANKLPELEKSKTYNASDVITMAMKVFAQDPKVVTIDADLAALSGLEPGAAYVDMTRALNVGVAEANMMSIGEGYAIMGYNVWVSTISVFFDWKVLRRIAISYQERMETIAAEDGWLSEGHGLDLTFVASSPNIELTTNGATHLGNDDIQVLGGIAHLKIIDISCPNLLLAVMKWIMEGNKGLVYIRIMRFPSAVIYDSDVNFEFGRGYVLKGSPEDAAIIVSSGRGVHEALSAAKELEQSGLKVKVVDMPSIDEQLMLDLYHSGKPIIIAEQNNGYIWSEYRKVLFKSKEKVDTSKLIPINTLDENGQPQFIHSGTYPQLLDRFGLSAKQLADVVRQRVDGEKP